MRRVRSQSGAVRAAAMLVRAFIAARPGPIAFLAVTLAVAVVAWLGFTTLATPFVGTASGSAAGSGIYINNVQHMRKLPLRYATRVEAMHGITDVAWMNYLPLICRPPTGVATLNGYAGPGTALQLKELNATPAQMKAWNADPLGVLIGATLATTCGWKAGMNVEPRDIAGHAVEVHVIGMIHSNVPFGDQIALAHYAYLNRLQPAGARNQAQVISANAVQAGGDNALAARIMAAFAHDDPPVVATTNTATQSAYARFGKVQVLLAWVMAAMLVCALLVLVSVLAHAAAERRKAMAVLLVLGFPRMTLIGIFIGECLLIGIIGAGVGIGVGLGVLHFLTPALAPIFGAIAPPGWAWAGLPVWIVVLLALGLVLPALISARTRAVDYRAI